MFTELPKLLDRNYMVGFLLPAALLTGVCWWILALFGLIPRPSSTDEVDTLIGGSIAIGMVWLVSILLLALNGQADRLLQGYGWTDIGLVLTREREKFDRDAAGVLKQQDAIDEARKHKHKVDPPKDFAIRMSKAVERYPDDRRWLLPTGFGNRIRAAEVYSRAVYGLDAATASYRISALLPTEFRELLNGARAQVDFCISVVVGGFIAAALFLGLGAYSGALPSPWPAAAAAAMIVGGYALAVQLAKPYGDYLRSAFDLGRAPLAEKLGLIIPDQPAEERKMWQAVSRMITFRSSYHFDALAPYRRKAVPPAAAARRKHKRKTARPAATAAKASAAGGAGAAVPESPAGQGE